jgi:hypothetical protein
MKMAKTMTYEKLLEAVRKLPPMTPAQEREQRISWTYGNISMHNPAVTREMCEKAVDEADRQRRLTPAERKGLGLPERALWDMKDEGSEHHDPQAGRRYGE